jgi:hypothetical protein
MAFNSSSPPRTGGAPSAHPTSVHAGARFKNGEIIERLTNSEVISKPHDA